MRGKRLLMKQKKLISTAGEIKYWKRKHDLIKYDNGREKIDHSFFRGQPD